MSQLLHEHWQADSRGQQSRICEPHPCLDEAPSIHPVAWPQICGDSANSTRKQDDCVGVCTTAAALNERECHVNFVLDELLVPAGHKVPSASRQEYTPDSSRDSHSALICSSSFATNSFLRRLSPREGTN